MRAVNDVLERKQAGPGVHGRWARLVEETAAYDGTIVLSMEFLGPAPPERIATIVRSWGDTPVEVVLTLRDLGRGVPAMWQEGLQNGGRIAWHDYVDRLGGRRQHAQAFWRQQGMGRIVDNWVDAVGPDRVTLVTVPLPGAAPGVLWERFCAAARIDGVDVEQVSAANTSLDAASAMVLHQLNGRLADGDLGFRDYHRRVKFGLAKGVMAGRGGPEWRRRARPRRRPTAPRSSAARPRCTVARPAAAAPDGPVPRGRPGRAGWGVVRPWT